MKMRRNSFLVTHVLVPQVIGSLIMGALITTSPAVGASYADEPFTFPATRAGEIARDYFEAYNSGDIERLRQHYADYRSEASLAERSAHERAERTLGMYDQMGALKPAVVTKETDTSIIITAEAVKLKMWVSCAFQLEEEEPHKLAMLMIGPTSPPEMATGSDLEWDSLTDLLDQVLAESGLPAIAVAVVEADGSIQAAVSGVRQVGSTDSVRIDDRFHIGSITKSMTATMIGRLVEEGLLGWDVTIAEALQEMEMRAEYRDVTLLDLLQHRSGLPGYLTFDDSTDVRLNALPGSPTEQRSAFVTEVLQAEPVARAGEEMNYSNAGYTVAALMAEEVAGPGWEKLMEKHVLGPASMERSGFGWPATEERPDQPRGHFYEESGLRPQVIGEYELGEFLAPAGDVHASIGDLALYAKMHLEGLAGVDAALKATTMSRLHLPPDADDDKPSYACGWMITEKPGLGSVHAHSGSAGTFFATVELYPETNRAIVVAANAGTGAGAVESIIQAINEKAGAGK
jgi:CubicO group peptidase (beta-lactamase class C family)